MNSDRVQNLEKRVAQELRELLRNDPASGPGAFSCRARLGEKPEGRSGEKALSEGIRSELRAEIGSDALLSITHTLSGHTLSGALHLTLGVGFRPGGARLGAGVDAESLERAVTPAIFERIYVQSSEREQARAVGLDPKPGWVIKEACFKAAPENSETLLPEYPLLEIFGSEQGGFRGTLGSAPRARKCRIEFRAFETEGFWLSVAVARAISADSP